MTLPRPSFTALRCFFASTRRALAALLTFVRTRLALDRLAGGQTLLVRLRGEEPRGNVPRTAVEQGHTLLAQRDEPDGTTVVVLRKKGRAP